MVKKRTVKSTKATKTEKPVKKDKKQMTETIMNTVGTKVSRTVNLDNFESVKIEFSLNKNIKMDADIEKELDGIFGLIEAKVDEKLEKYEEEVPEEKEPEDEPEEEEEESEEEEPEEDEEEDETEDDEEPEEDDDISEEAIMAMKKKELVALIKEEGLEDEVNPKEFSKIGELRKAVIDAMFEEDGDDSDDSEEWDDDEWADDDD
jgi:hypothetical protein